MADVKYSVEVESAQATKQVEQLDQAWKQVEKTAPATKTVMGELGKAVGDVAGAFTVATLAADAIRGAISGVKDFISSSIEGAMEEEASQFRLKTALELTGRARAGATRDMLAFAEQMSQVTTYSHEEVEATETLLAQLTKLDTEGIKEMTKGIIGLSSVLGPNEGLEGATSRVTRAIEGNAQGLRRVGIEIDTTLPKGEQLIQIQEKLGALFPRATAELGTMQGEVKNLKKEWAELKEQFGGFLLDSVNAEENVPRLTKVIKYLRTELNATAEAINYATVSQAMFGAGLANWKGGGELPMEKILAVLKRDLPEVKIQYEVLMAAFLKGPEAFNKYVQMMIAVNSILEKAKGAAEGGQQAAFNLGQAFEDLGIKGGPALQAQLKLAKDTLAEYQKTANPLPGVIYALTEKVNELTLAVKGPKDPIEAVIGTLRKAEPVFKSAQEQWDELQRKWLEAWDLENKLPEINWDAIVAEMFPPPAEVPFLEGLLSNFREASNEVKVQAGVMRANLDSITSKTTLNSQLVALKQKFDDMTKSGDYTAEALQGVRKAIKGVEDELRDTPQWILKMQDAMAKAAPYINNALQGMSAIVSQTQKNKEIQIENEYKKRLATINATVKDETEKQKAITALEAEFEIKRTSARAAAAKQAKSIALAEAVWNTARAITEALPNVVLAAIVGALGAIQIATIAKQPIPLARGAVFRKPTFMTDPKGRTYEMGEEGPEYLIPEKHIAPLLSNRPPGFVAPAGSGIGKGSRPAPVFNINSPLVQAYGFSTSDLELAGDKLVQVMRRQARRRGGRYA